MRLAHILKSKWVHHACLAFGFGLLAYFVRAFGWERILLKLRELGWSFGIILAISAGWYVLNCLGWEQFLRERRSQLSLFTLFRIKLAGEAVNTATPANWVGGDPLRIALLRRFTSTSEGAASVILDRTIHSLTIVVLMAIGVLLALITLDLPRAMNEILSAVVVLMIMGTAIAIYRQHNGVLTPLVSIADRLHLGRFIKENARTKIAMTDRQIQTFYQRDKTRLLFAVLYHLLGRLLGVLEIYTIAMIFHIPLTFLNAYFLAMLNALINFTFVFIPGSMGVLEGAYGGLFHILHLDPAAGVSVQLVRRLRTFFWTALGFAFIWIDQPASKKR